MKLKCINIAPKRVHRCNITVGKTYEGKSISANSFYLVDDTNHRDYYPKEWFEVVPDIIYTREYLIENNIAVQVDNIEEEKELIELGLHWFSRADIRTSMAGEFPYVYYITKNSGGWSIEKGFIKVGYKTLTNPQTTIQKVITASEILSQYKNQQQMKKIIGYKAPKDMYGGQVLKDTLFHATSSTPTPRAMYVAIDDNKKIIDPKFELPKEIVEDWEAVYEEEKKEFDHIIGTPNRKINITRTGIISGSDIDMFTIEDVKEIIRRMSSNFTRIGGLDVKWVNPTIHVGCGLGPNITLQELKDLVTKFEQEFK